MRIKSDWKKIGECGVDAGCLLIIDPCYVKYFVENGRTIEEWYQKFICEPDWNLHTPTDEHGLGIVFSSGYGDGCYPVMARIEDGRVMEVRIRFDGEDDE